MKIVFIFVQTLQGMGIKNHLKNHHPKTIFLPFLVSSNSLNSLSSGKALNPREAGTEVLTERKKTKQNTSPATPLPQTVAWHIWGQGKMLPGFYRLAFLGEFMQMRLELHGR